MDELKEMFAKLAEQGWILEIRVPDKETTYTTIDNLYWKGKPLLEYLTPTGERPGPL